MANIGKSGVLLLYKHLLRESSKFTSYNFRSYALRKIRDSFRANKNLSDIDVIHKEVEKARTNLDILRRQIIINQLFASEKLVIEHESMNH